MKKICASEVYEVYMELDHSDADSDGAVALVADTATLL